MTAKNLYQRAMVIFGGVMVFFYLGFGLFFIFSPLFDHINDFIRIAFGSAFALYGVVRAFRTYEQVREVFFSEDDTNE